MDPSMKTDTVQIEAAAPRQTVQEAVEMQRAISSGEVDAFVVGQGEERKRVLMLSEAHVRYKSSSRTCSRRADRVRLGTSVREPQLRGDARPAADRPSSQLARKPRFGAGRGRIAALLSPDLGQPDMRSSSHARRRDRPVRIS